MLPCNETAEPNSPVDLAPDTEDNGLATMLGELMRQNLAAHPCKRRDFDRLEATVAIQANDAGVGLTMTFRQGHCLIVNGARKGTQLRVEGDSEAILALANAPFGRVLPRLHGEAAKLFLQLLRSKRIRLQGAIRHPISFLRLGRIISVHGPDQQ